MIAYRLTLPQYANDLSGIGASMFGGRWNSIGNFILYTTQTSSLSILEHLVHMQGAKNDVKYRLSVIDVANSLIQKVDSDFMEIGNQKLTQNAGDNWLRSQQSPVLEVPSIINPLESNYLINPNHPKLEIRIHSQEWFVYDNRLLKGSI
ncbi:MAG: RES domain-containing protein [Cyclobacteriaceae bacterium]